MNPPEAYLGRGQPRLQQLILRVYAGFCALLLDLNQAARIGFLLARRLQLAAYGIKLDVCRG